MGINELKQSIDMTMFIVDLFVCFLVFIMFFIVFAPIFASFLRQSFYNLPKLLLTALGKWWLGVMDRDILLTFPIFEVFTLTFVNITLRYLTLSYA